MYMANMHNETLLYKHDYGRNVEKINLQSCQYNHVTKFEIQPLTFQLCPLISNILSVWTFEGYKCLNLVAQSLSCSNCCVSLDFIWNILTSNNANITVHKNRKFHLWLMIPLKGPPTKHLTSNHANITTLQSSKFNLWLFNYALWFQTFCVNLWRSQKFEFRCIIAEKEFNRHKAWVAQTAVFY